MPHASQIKSQLGMNLALVAVIAGGIIAGLLGVVWIAAMVLLRSGGSPGIFFFVALAFVLLGSYRLGAERRATELARTFPNAYLLHVLVLGKQRSALQKYGKDAGTPVHIPLLGVRGTLVATADWVRIYRGSAKPTVVFEVPSAKVTASTLVARKQVFGSQSILTLDLAGPTGTEPVEISAVHFANISPVAIPEQFFDVELTGLNAAVHPVVSK